MIDPCSRRVLVTGANGFIGRALCARLLADGFLVRGVVRKLSRSVSLPQGIEIVPIGFIGPDTEWTDVMNGVDSVIHLAARAHVMREMADDPLCEFRRVNTRGTERMALMAVRAGVRRIVFVSSIGVNGESSGEKAFTESDTPSPHNPYAISKWEAECALQSAAEEGLETVVVRSPLVYGPAVPGNFLRLLHLVRKGLPLPFGATHNERSLIYLENLVDAIVTCINNPKATGQTYLVSDGEDVSTPELIRRVAAALGRPARLFPFPPALMHVAGKLLGKSAEMEKLLGSLTIDSGKICRELQWTAPFTMTDGLKKTADWYLKGRLSVA